MTTRAATIADAADMADILNRVIAIGGTTAHEDPMTAEAVLEDYVNGADVYSSVVALDGNVVIGWQLVGLWQGEAHIGTFVDPGKQARGAGSAMFALTRAILGTAGVATIIASIRAANAPGLVYYTRLGFVDFARDPQFALRDGRVVGRVHRRYELL
jgi:L-amino acid N-acyltransferase YncA